MSSGDPRIIDGLFARRHDKACAFDQARSEQVVADAADTEQEARRIASMHNVFQRDWQDPHFAVADAMETLETHVFGDVIFRSEPVVVEGRKRVAKRG